MRKILIIIILFLGFLRTAVYADSATAYKDYLYQYDQYRTSLNEFKVARSEYLKFNTLTSQQTALEKTKQMLMARSQLLRSYLLFLNEKLAESSSMDPANKSLYQSLINNEIKFLDNQISLVGSIGSLTDAESVSQQLTSHYAILTSSIYQTITALKLADLMTADNVYYQLFANSYQLIQDNKASYAPGKLSIMDRWLLQIQNKRDLFKQKTDEIAKENALLKSSSVSDIQSTYQNIQKEMSEGKQYLSEGTGFLQELITSMQYKE